MSDDTDLEPFLFMALVTALIGLLVLFAVPPVGELPEKDDTAEDSIALTYYVENETNTTIHGPRNLTIDGQEITVKFEPCSNYTYVNDEPHPCQ